MTRFNRLGVLAGALLSLPLMSTAADAGQETANITIQANVVAACTLVTPPPALIDFGDIVPGSGFPSSVGPFEATVNCPQGFPYEWGFNGGLNPSLSPEPQMLLVGGDSVNSDDLLAYFMTGDDGLGVGDTGGALINSGTNISPVKEGIGTGADQQLIFNANAGPVENPNQSVGPYADTITFLFAF